MVTSPNLALRIWNLSTDPYDSGQLADNWARVDQHDHSLGKGVQVPTGGIADAAITQAKIAPGVSLPAASVPAGSITTTELQDGGIQSVDIGNGQVTTAKLATGAVTSNEILDNTIGAGDIANAELNRLGLSGGGVVRRGSFVPATPFSETFSPGASYVYATTPDRVSSVNLPTNGLIVVAYQATWRESVANAAYAAIFVGINQVKIAPHSTTGGIGPVIQEAGTFSTGTANQDTALATKVDGLASEIVDGVGAYGGDVTTGQIVGTSNVNAGPCYIFAAAGTYDVGIKFKTSSGSITRKNPRLLVWTIAF